MENFVSEVFSMGCEYLGRMVVNRSAASAVEIQLITNKITLTRRNNWCHVRLSIYCSAAKNGAKHGFD